MRKSNVSMHINVPIFGLKYYDNPIIISIDNLKHD